MCTVESGSVKSQSGYVLYKLRKWVCRESKWVCTVESRSVRSQNGSVPKNAGLSGVKVGLSVESGSVKSQSGSVL